MNKEKKEKKLFTALKEWRSKAAKENNLDEYMILQNKTLTWISEEKPKTKDALKNICGIGEIKIEKYGDALIRIIKEDVNFKDLTAYLELKGSEAEDKLKSDFKTKIFTVGELTKHIKDLLESDDELADLWVRGEISNLKKNASSGHTYFSLKDEKSQIRCILFRRAGENINFKLEHGMKVIVRGSIELYEPYGEYSIIAEEVQPDGLGALNLAFMQLKEKLEKEGLFSIEHKKPLPEFPKVIGIVTSAAGAAVQDILNIIKRRYPLVKIIIAPTLVQGKEAADSIAGSVELMNELPQVDVIILGRGGGSLEDLWAFNEEVVARAIFNSKIPIISAVGHETDFTISDFVADYRAPTPSAAAEKAVPDIKDLYENIRNFRSRSLTAVKHNIEIYKSGLKQITDRPVFRRPFDRIRVYYRDLDYLSDKLQNNFQKTITSKKREIEIIESKAAALNPESVLKRGYSLIMKDNKIIKKFSDVNINDEIDITLHEGKLEAQIKKIRGNQK